MEWSFEQAEIHHWFKTSKIQDETIQNLVVVARAGTGKTTTILHGVTLAPEPSILIAAFSKSIRIELDAKLKKMNARKGIKAQTLHSVGLALINMFKTRVVVDFSEDRAEAITAAVCDQTVPEAIKKLVTKLHTKGREVAPLARYYGDLSEIQVRYDCCVDETWEMSHFNDEYVEMKALEAMEWAAGIRTGATIDGSDMIFLPVRNRWLLPMYDMVVVDEAQDMTTAQLAISTGVLKKNGRICVVGDNRQAIFAFRGADSESLSRLKHELNAAELGLKTTYRCGKAIVELAKNYVPDYVAAPQNPEGEVLDLGVEHLTTLAGPNDFILSRTNAPLVPLALRLMAQGKRTRINGADLGKGLISLIEKFKARSIPDLLNRIEAWASKQIARLEAQKSSAISKGRLNAIADKMAGVEERAMMLTELARDAKSVAEVTDRVKFLFADKDSTNLPGFITCSTIHKAKGLEADRVFVLEDTLRFGNIEEENICYVGYTRAKQTLFRMSGQE